MRVVFFAQLREDLKVSELEVSVTKASSLKKLKNYLIDLHPEWAFFLDNKLLLMAVNYHYVKTDVVLSETDEIAFFPPVTGG
jgi:sulfur-carrier protein